MFDIIIEVRKKRMRKENVVKNKCLKKFKAKIKENEKEFSLLRFCSYLENYSSTIYINQLL